MNIYPSIHLDLVENVDNNMKHETDFIIKRNEFSAEHKIKNEVSHLLCKWKRHL